MPSPEQEHNKRLVWQFWQALEAAAPEAVAAVAASGWSETVAWTGFHPFNHLAGREAVVRGWWQPLRAAFPDLRRDVYILLGGTFAGQDWVSATGCFTGTFAADWAGIPASGRAFPFRPVV